MPVVESGVTCQGIVEMSNLIPAERTHGLHLVYLLNYVHRTSEFFARTDDALLDAYTRDLDTLFPGASASIAERFLFRAPFVEPIWPLGYRALRPSTTVIPDRLHLVCTAQVYPRVNSWSACCDVVEEMMAGMTAATDERAAAPR
jgi:protoporphyrinogen oxidase